jgi:hypothetical protein
MITERDIVAHAARRARRIFLLKVALLGALAAAHRANFRRNLLVASCGRFKAPRPHNPSQSEMFSEQRIPLGQEFRRHRRKPCT